MDETTELTQVNQDDIWLSPAYGRDSAHIAVHMYKGMPYQPYFQRIEAIPHLEYFLALRTHMDPDGLFLNPYLSELFGVPVRT